MKKLNKILALLLALVMVLSLAACGGGEAETTAPKGGETDPVVTEGTEPVEEVSKLNKDIYPLDCDTVFTMVTARENPEDIYTFGLWEEVTGLEFDYITMQAEQLKMALAGGDIPDAIIYLNASYVTKEMAYEYGSAGKFINFMDYLEYMPNFAAAIEKYPQLLLPVQNEDGSVYTLPRIISTATGHTPVMFFRTDMMTAAGWENPPATTAEFIQYIKDVQAVLGADNDSFIAMNGHGKGVMAWDSGIMPKFFFPSFGELMETGLSVGSDGNVVLGAATEQFKHYLEFVHEIYTSGAFNTDVYTEDGTNTRANASNNNVAVSTYMSYLTADNFESGEIEMILLPPLTSEYYSEQHWLPNSMYQYNVNMVSAECENIEALCRYFDAFYATEENPLNEEGTIWGVSMWLGEHGVDFEIDKENNSYTILPHEGYDSPSAWQNNEVVGSIGIFEFNYLDGSVRGKYTVENLMPHAVEDYLYLSAINLTEDEMMDYTDYWTDITNYIAEMSAKFIVGEEDIDAKWDEYMSTLESMGLQNVLDIYQGALDRYLAG